MRVGYENGHYYVVIHERDVYGRAARSFIAGSPLADWRIMQWTQSGSLVMTKERISSRNLELQG